MCFLKRKNTRSLNNIKPFVSHNMWYMRLENILLDHLCEIEAEGMEIAYKIGVHKLTILSRAPGFLCGFRGINTEKLKERLKNNGYPDITEVAYDEITNTLPKKKWKKSKIRNEDKAILSAFSSEF